MHLSKNFDWDLKLSDKELMVFIKLLKGHDLNDDETQLADHLESVLPMIREKQLDTRPSGPHRFNGPRRNGFQRPVNNANSNGHGEILTPAPALVGEDQS
jgi:hypothetical protein